MQGLAAVWAGVAWSALVLPTLTHAHQFKFGRCKNPKSVENFDPARFNGTWFVQRKLATSSSCMSVTFDWDEGASRFRVQERRTPLLTSMTPLDVQVTNVGFLTVTGTSGTMNLQWEGVVANLFSYVFSVVATDYDNFAVTSECQSLMSVAKRVSGSVLTRTQDVSEEEIAQYMRELENHPDVDPSRLNTIQQSGCLSPDEIDYKVNYDDNGLSLMSLVSNEVKNIHTVAEAEEYVKKIQENEVEE